MRFVTLEDLSEKVDCVCFHKKLLEYGEILQVDSRVIITGRVQHRDDQISVLIENVVSLDSSSMVTVKLLEEVSYEELHGIKNILAQHHGEDPVMMELAPANGNTKIMTSPLFWVKASSDLTNNLKHIFPDKVEVLVNSMDKPL